MKNLAIHNGFRGLILLFCIFGFQSFAEVLDLKTVDRGLHHKTMEYKTTYKDLLGNTRTNTHRYTILENGISRLENGKWVDADDSIQLVDDGAAVTGTAYKAKFSSNLNKRLL